MVSTLSVPLSTLCIHRRHETVLVVTLTLYDAPNTGDGDDNEVEGDNTDADAILSVE